VVLILVGLIAAPAAAETSVVGNLVIAPTAAWNMQDNNAVIRTTAYTTVYDWVKAGYNNGSWTGVGIRSAAAAGNSNTSLGTVYNNVGGNTIWATGAAIGAEFNIPELATLTTNDVIIKYTYIGDANLDGFVNVADKSLLDANFGQSGGWFQGDFNYDGVVNVADKSLLDARFGLGGLSGSVVEVGSASAVPEPGTMATLLVALAGMIGWCAVRRRSR
jgi:hypothetical protein